MFDASSDAFGRGEIAWWLRQELKTILKWNACRLRMGAWTQVSNRLAQRRKENEKREE